MPEANTMDCPHVQNLLSAYYDQELAPAEAAEVAQHVAHCAACAGELAEFEELTARTQSLPHPAPPPDLWTQLAAQLPTDHAADSRQEPRRGGLSRRRQPAGQAVFAAAAVVIVTLGWWGFQAWYGSWSSSHREQQMAAVLERYLDEFATDPHSAQQFLLASYQSRAVAADQAGQAVGYRPLVAAGLPPGYQLVSTHVMDMPCCTCVQCLCQREDGTALAIFEHDDEESVWLASREARDQVCHGVRCSLIQLDERLAATWRRGTRHISIIGARDTEEVSRLVAWFDQRR